MSFRLPDASSPSTPQRKPRGRFPYFKDGAEHPSTTPAGPPPSSAPSFTPVGEPSPSFLQSSIGAMGTGKVKPPNFGRPALGRPSRGSNAPLGSSIRGTGTHKQSGLSKHSYSVLDDLGDSEGGEEEEEPIASNRPGTYGMLEDDDEDDMDEDAPGDEDEDAEGDEEYSVEDDGGAMDEDGDDEYDIEEELLKEIAGDDLARAQMEADTMDLVMMATPAADRRVSEEAEEIFRASAMQSSHGLSRDFRFAAVARDLYTQLGYADITESSDVILHTEDIINRLYDDGVGAEDDKERLDDTLEATATGLIKDIWEPFAKSLPMDNAEHEATVGPGPNAPDFEKAAWIAALLFRLHHAPPIADQLGGQQIPPLPQVLFQWQDEYHTSIKGTIETIQLHNPSPSSHPLFWQGVYSSVIHGHVSTAISLLRRAGWDKVRKGTRGEPSYSGHGLSSINRAVEDVCLVMDTCPATTDKNWDIYNSDWTLFRLKARAARESLINFAEGKDRPHRPVSGSLDGSNLSVSHDGRLAGLARRAESRLPWDIYESLQSLYSILIGESDAIMAAGQDWCEATIGLFAWWDDGHSSRRIQLSRSQPVAVHTLSEDSWLERLALSFYTAMESDFHFNSLDPIEVSIASAFEGNTEAVIGFLRAWSLPVASAVAEIASLGLWLPPFEPANLIAMDSLDNDDLDLLGMSRSAMPPDSDGVKDGTLIHYARALNNVKQLSGMIKRKSGARIRITREGWELAVQVVGRMDKPAKSEEMVDELLRDILDQIGPDSHTTVDKIWALLNNLGMINFAEDTAEKFGDILKESGYQFGDMLWYYALAHRPGKVRDVVNGLISLSLAESTTYPPKGELDETLGKLLMERTATLEQFAKQDLEAAELLGKMLSGYFTLRLFYEVRDSEGKTGSNSIARRQQAATALIAVIASADDNIRGGLYDDTLDSVVSEDFVLALLGEASVFINQSPTSVTLAQMDTLLKTVEDIQTVGSRVYEAADAFYQLVLSSGHGKGSTPADLMRKSTSSLSGSYMMTGSSMMASQLHKSVRDSGVLKGQMKRGWDWRGNVLANSSAADLLKKMRLGLSKDLAALWLEQADSVIL